ncbi:helix-turn-helix transcriptional regulator [Sphingomonas sabuli]|uniref:Helix-turn-helix transcriptional regulator n=1 Tax=Sphingomonas sabuli TaxID=2764186 RepID=A0A7G9L5L2_9SPHN|nr:helix-turn-helix transcriptional regulator [Sphingomonas sabuli]QNM83911.1 helix-turn-helix transcriptional regulator [Sphingomonas sabuli]
MTNIERKARVPNPALWGDSPADQEPDVAQRVAKLTDGQLDCLRLVANHLSSKEIAVELGISPHTVDQRIRQSLATLGVARRSQAARIVARHREPYQSLIHQPPYIEGEPAAGDEDGAVSNQIRHAGRAGETWGGSGFQTEQKRGSSWSSLQLPFATRSHPRNEMSVGLRLLWIVVIAIGAAFSAGMYLAGLESLARMMQS